MAAQHLFVFADRRGAGLQFTMCGLTEAVLRRIPRVAYVKPIVAEPSDENIAFILRRFTLDLKPQEAFFFTLDEAEHIIASEGEKTLFTRIIERAEALETQFDFILYEGIESDRFANIIERDINIEIAKHLSAPVIHLINADNVALTQLRDTFHLYDEMLREVGLDRVCTIFNRASQSVSDALLQTGERIFVIPEVPALSRRTLADIEHLVEVPSERNVRFRTWERILPAVARAERTLEEADAKTLLVASADRDDLFDALQKRCAQTHFEGIAALIVTGEDEVSNGMMRPEAFPLLRSRRGAFETLCALNETRARFHLEDEKKFAAAMGVFRRYVDTDRIARYFKEAESETMTPVMFEYLLFERARRNKRRIILPESDDERVLEAAQRVLARDIADIVFVADGSLYKRARRLGFDLDDANILSIGDERLRARFAEAYYAMRKQKGVTREEAAALMHDINFFATMAVVCGLADGLVSGATHTTAETVRPALQLLRGDGGFRSVSSIFFMGLETRVLVFGDCAVIQDPTSEELAHIAVHAADNARHFGIEPRVAMISYATGTSAEGKDVEKVRRALEQVRSLRPDLLVDGPMQFDAAFDAEVGARKLPGSPVAGRATVYIFPDLNTGNTVYKAVQRSSGAVATGPILQGLRKPVNDLSRGATVEDIVDTIAVTAIQAQMKEADDGACRQ
jgi:phosphate acetyltransferase